MKSMDSFQTSKNANATGNGLYQYGFTASAEL
jgi:hypothetical protein